MKKMRSIVACAGPAGSMHPHSPYAIPPKTSTQQFEDMAMTETIDAIFSDLHVDGRQRTGARC